MWPYHGLHQWVQFWLSYCVIQAQESSGVSKHWRFWLYGISIIISVQLQFFAETKPPGNSEGSTMLIPKSIFGTQSEPVHNLIIYMSRTHFNITLSCLSQFFTTCKIIFYLVYFNIALIYRKLNLTENYISNNVLTYVYCTFHTNVSSQSNQNIYSKYKLVI